MGKLQINVINTISGNHLLEYELTVKNQGKIVRVYCEPLECILNDSGSIKEYRVLKVYEVEKYLLGKNPSSSEEVVIPSYEAPDQLKEYYKVLNTYGKDIFNKMI